MCSSCKNGEKRCSYNQREVGETTPTCCTKRRLLELAGLVINLAIDVVYVNDCSFCYSIDRKIKFRAIVELGRRKKQLDHTAKELFEALRMILLFYNKANIKIDTVHAHN